MSNRGTDSKRERRIERQDEEKDRTAG
jgi:hypothetical protein